MAEEKICFEFAKESFYNLTQQNKIKLISIQSMPLFLLSHSMKSSISYWEFIQEVQNSADYENCNRI